MNSEQNLCNPNLFDQHYTDEYYITSFIRRMGARDYILRKKENNLNSEYNIKVEVQTKSELSDMNQRKCLILPDNRTVGFVWTK